MNKFIEVLGVFVGGGLFGYFIKYALDFQYTKKIDQMNKKRTVYENLAEYLAIFVSGRPVTAEQKDNFLETYSQCWLWASDDVVKEIADFLDYQIDISLGEEVGQEEMKYKYALCMLAMRKDLEFSKTSLRDSDYKFISF